MLPMVLSFGAVHNFVEESGVVLSIIRSIVLARVLPMVLSVGAVHNFVEESGVVLPIICRP